MNQDFIVLTEIGTDNKVAVRKSIVDTISPWKGKTNKESVSESVGVSIWSTSNQLERPFIICSETFSQVVEKMVEPLVN